MSVSGKRVAVVFGSRSPEHEISVITACQVMPVLVELGLEVIPVYVTKRGRWLTDPTFGELTTFRRGLPEDGTPVLPDLGRGALRLGGGGLLGRPRDLAVDVIFPLVHGSHGEDGTLAALADLLPAPQVGSGTLGGALAMDKHCSKLVLGAAGLPVVEGHLARTREEALAAAGRLGGSVVIKPNRSGSSIGVSLVESPADLGAAVELALRFDSEVVVERAVPGAEDLNCAVKRGEPRASAVERPHKAQGLLSYQDKYASQGRPGSKAKGKGDGRRELPAAIDGELRERIQRLAVVAFDQLGCGGTARVDFLLSGSGELFVNEVNTIPGSLAFYLWEATGIGFPELLSELVEEALRLGPGLEPALEGNLLAEGQLLGK